MRCAEGDQIGEIIAASAPLCMGKFCLVERANEIVIHIHALLLCEVHAEFASGLRTASFRTTKGRCCSECVPVRGSICCRDSYEHRVVLAPNNISTEINRAGCGDGFASLDFESPAVQRAFNNVTLDKTFAQHCERVRAHIVDSIEFAINIEDGDLPLIELYTQPLALSNLGGRGNAMKTISRLAHPATLSAPAARPLAHRLPRRGKGEQQRFDSFARIRHFIDNY
jgi:hypothetical protein